MMKDTAEALSYLHSRGIMHGDIKMLNVLRLKTRLQLIDMDAAAVIGESFSGAKFSSGILPPEMFCKLDEEGVKMHEEYWRMQARKIDGIGSTADQGTCTAASIEENDGDFSMYSASVVALWEKVRPIRTKRGTFVVKSFNSAHAASIISGDIRSTVADIDRLPFGDHLVQASACPRHLVFRLGSVSDVPADPLLVVNLDDDLSEPEAVLQAATWFDAKLNDRIDKYISDPAAAADLLKLILRANPATRMKSMDDVLRHPFFKDGGGSILDAHSKQLLEDIVNGQKAQTKMIQGIQKQTDAILKKMVTIENLSLKLFNKLCSTEKVKKM
jgi:serine/threonine protein kinase